MIYVRDKDGLSSRAHAPTDLQAKADTPVAMTDVGPFLPLARALEVDARMRDLLARALPIRALASHRNVRIAVAALALLPIAFLVAIDVRVMKTDGAAPLRFLLVDLLLAAYVAFEVARPTPRLPQVGAMALAAVALRWTSFIARLCGRSELSWYVYLAPIAATVGAVLLLTRVPSRARVVLELLDKLGITRNDARDVTEPKEPNGRLVAFALGAAAALPALLWLLRKNDLDLLLQAGVFVAYALGAPYIAERIEPTERTPTPPIRIVWGIFVGLALTVATMTAARCFVDTGTDLARCFDRLDAEARRLVERESVELGKAILRVRGSSLLFALTAIVFPFAEEQVYRNVLQRTLVRKYGNAYGLFASAVVFGIAHVGVYQIDLYQTVLLGIAFGVAYLEGGLLASVIVHATWNLLLLI